MNSDHLGSSPQPDRTSPSTGALVYSACNEMARQAFKAAGRNYHAEKVAAEREQMRRYWIALAAEQERCRVAQVPLVIGIGLDYGIPAAPGYRWAA